MTRNNLEYRSFFRFKMLDLKRRRKLCQCTDFIVVILGLWFKLNRHERYGLSLSIIKADLHG